MRRASLIVTALLLASTASAQNIARPHAGYIVDQTRTISRSDAEAINKVCRDVDARTNGELLVAVIRSTNGQNANRFATRLFNRWGIGDRDEDNGILVFVAMNDRKAEIILGDGIDSPREERHARDVMSDYMMPKFKQRQPSKGIRIAVEELAERFFRVDESIPTHAASKQHATTSPHVAATPSFDPVPNFDEIESADGVTSAAETTAAEDFDIEHAEVFTNLDATSHGPTAHDIAHIQADNHVTHDLAGGHEPYVAIQPRRIPAQGNNNWLGWLFGAGATAGGVGLSYHLLTARRRPRRCKHCDQMMVLLDEANDDAHLSSSERLEERLGSVDYDVWVCSGCQDVQKIRYGAFFTRYSSCPECRAKTSSSVTRTIESATTYSQGLKEVEETCKNCDFHRVTQHTIPRIEETTTHSASTGFSSSSSFDSGSSFSSSSGFDGGGFGGGSSSRGGASGSW